MEDKAEFKKPKLALVRGDTYGEWDSRSWRSLADDFDMTVFCSKGNSYNKFESGIPVKKIFSSSDNFILKQSLKYFSGQYKRMFGLEKQLARFDLVHTYEVYNYYTLQSIRAKKRNKNLKVIVNVIDNTIGRFEYNYWPGFKSPPAYWRKKLKNITKEVINGADMFLAVTQYTADVFLGEFGVDRDRIRVLGNAEAEAPEIKKEELCLKLGIADRELYLAVNRLIKEKGIYELLYGWRMYLSGSVNRDNKLLLLVGDGPERSNIARLIKEWALESNIKIITHLPNVEVRNLYRYSKCLILDSLPTSVWQEQFGHVLAEAIIADCPVISTYSGAIPEVMEGAGLLVPPGNSVEIKKALIMLDDEPLYDKLKTNCAKIKYKFNPKYFRDKLLGYCQELKLLN